MITKYTEYIKENLNSKQSIKEWLDSMIIKNYTINDDLTVDVNDNVYISVRRLTEIPVKFNKVNGHFNCNNNRLTSLENVPKIIKGHFSCYDNKLTSLEGCPTTINNNFFCFSNNLTSLKGCPTKINNSFDCSNNKLTTLKDCPTFVGDLFYCSNNPLEDINDLDSKILIKSIKYIKVSQEVFDKYFELWIEKDINIFDVLKDKVSDKIKNKYDYLFNAKNFDLL